MSYKTNPIANRLNINKGFSNTHFFNNKSAYNHNLIFWLSLYLFMKSYLAFNKIKLLSCEIRIVSQTQKILYISILKDPKIKKKKKQKKVYLSKINRANNKNIIYLIYKNLNNLKRLYILKKKNHYKPLRLYHTNIDKLRIFYKRRKILNILKNKKINANRFYKISYKNQLAANSFNIFFLKKKILKIKSIINKINELKKLAIFFNNNSNVNNILFSIWIQKQLANISFQKKKIKRTFFVTYQKFQFGHRQYFYINKQNWKKGVQRQTFYLKQFYSCRDRFSETDQIYFLTEKNYYRWKLFYHHKLYLHYVTFYKNQHKKILSFLLLQLKRLFFKKKNRYILIKSYKKIKKKINWQLRLIKKLHTPFLKKRTIKLKFLHYWYLYLLNYYKTKAHSSLLIKKFRKVYWKTKKKKTYHKLKLKIGNRNFIYKIRKSFLLLNWNNKLCITVKKKFAMQIKNKRKKSKRYLLKFPVKIKKTKNNKIKRRRSQFVVKKKTIVKKRRLFNNKIYIQKTIKDEYFKYKIHETTANLQFILEKLIAKHFHISFLVKATSFNTIFNNKQIFLDIRPTKIHQIMEIKPLFINSGQYSKSFKINKLNILNINNNNYMDTEDGIEKKKENFSNNNKILGKSFYIFINYRKYLNAQLLADQISNLLCKKKKHIPILESVTALIDALPENPIISYRITIHGKINSKSRATNVTIVQGHIPTQNFLERINFGLSQAKTPTGTFGIRVYVHF